eukprot:3892419-Alexandrium_andersonii.AAC.1
MAPALVVDARPLVESALQLELVWPEVSHVLLWCVIFLAGFWVGRRSGGVAPAAPAAPPRARSRAQRWLEGADEEVAPKFVRGADVMVLDGLVHGSPSHGSGDERRRRCLCCWRVPLTDQEKLYMIQFGEVVHASMVCGGMKDSRYEPIPLRPSLWAGGIEPRVGMAHRRRKTELAGGRFALGASVALMSHLHGFILIGLRAP